MKRKIISAIFMAILASSLMGCANNSESLSTQTAQEYEISAEQIKADLIGHYLTGEGLGWTFAALSEYEQFDIRDTQRQGDVIEYDVSMRLVDLASDEHFLADVLIVYRKGQDKWELISTVTKVFENVSGDIFW